MRLSEPRIRDARPEERDAIRALTLAAYAEYGTRMEPTAWAALEEALHRALALEEERVERIVAQRDGRLVGSVMLYPAAIDAYHGAIEGGLEWPEVRLLAVAEEERGRGVGAALVEECARRARLAGATALGLHTSGSMRAAIRLYERLGFERAPRHDFRPPGGELVTAYRLPLGDRAPAPR